MLFAIEMLVFVSTEIWNHYENTELPTRWRDGISSGTHRFSRHHPNIFMFIEQMKHEQAENETIMKMLELGHQGIAQKKKRKRVYDRAGVLKNRLRDGEICIFSYLDAVSYCIHL